MQYEIMWVDLDPTQGSEISKTRPGVIISPDEMNDHLATVIIAPLTSTIKGYKSRMIILVNGVENEIALDQIRTVSKGRLKRSLQGKSKLTAVEIAEVKSILNEMLVK